MIRIYVNLLKKNNTCIWCKKKENDVKYKKKYI